MIYPIRLYAGSVHCYFRDNETRVLSVKRTCGDPPSPRARRVERPWRPLRAGAQRPARDSSRSDGRVMQSGACAVSRDDGACDGGPAPTSVDALARPRLRQRPHASALSTASATPFYLSATRDRDEISAVRRSGPEVVRSGDDSGLAHRDALNRGHTCPDVEREHLTCPGFTSKPKRTEGRM